MTKTDAGSRVTIQMRSRVTGAPRDTDESLRADVVALIAEFGEVLEPMHAGATDPLLTPFYVVDLPSRAMAMALRDKLVQHPAVEAAYVAPAPGLP